MNNQRTRSIAVLACCAALLASAAPVSTGLSSVALAKIHPRLQQFVDRGTAAGFVVLVARHGEIALLDAAGWQDKESKTPMRTSSMFQIMSMTKPITCAAVMTLADDGQLSINDPVEKYLPEFKDVKMRSGAAPGHPITIRELMTHTSGVPASSSRGFDRHAHTLAEVVADAAHEPLDFEPGSEWHYSNNGIATLGRILEVVAEKPFERVMEERIFAPLGMRDTAFWMPADKASRLAAVYTDDHGVLKPAGADPLRKGWKYPMPEGGVYSTASDLFHFYQMMLNKGSFGTHRVLSPAAVELMTTLQTGDLKAGFQPGVGWGLGWGIVKDTTGMFRYNSIGTYGHGGAYRTYAFVDPKRDLIGVILYQRTNVGGDIADEITSFVQMANAAVQ